MFRSRPRRLTLQRPEGPSKRWTRGAASLARRRVRVAAIRRETADAVTVRLEPEDGATLPFRAGQYLTHCMEVDGKPLRRAFSISAPEGGALECTARVIDGGRMSTHMAQRLRAGDRYDVLGPTGDFVLPEDAAAPLVFVAGGSGITPVISLVETALARSPTRSMKLLYASRTQDAIIFGERLEALAARHPSLQVTHVLSQPAPGWSGERGRLDAARLASLLGTATARDAIVYLCGPAGLMDAAAQGLAAAGLDGARLRREQFIAAPQASRPTEPQDILFRRSGRRVMQQPGETILEAGLRAGIALEYSCTVGGCAHCKVQVVQGTALLSEPNCLSAAERLAGWTLACSACAAGPLVVEA